MDKFDVAVIGSGPGGYVAAIRAAQLGASVALVEKEYLGGTCLNWGCIPTKALIASAEMLHNMRQASQFGITLDGEVRPDWPAVIKGKNEIVKGLRQGVAGLLKANRVKVLTGHGSFDSRRRIRVRAPGQETCLECDHTILATGSVSVKPSFIPPSDHIVYSRQALDLTELPESMIVLGGGVIGCEFACMFARFGVNVTVVEMLPEILSMADRDIVRVVRTSMKKMGIEVLTGQPLEKIKATGKGVSGKVGKDTVQAKKMLVCVGRRPFTDGLGLPAAGLDTDDRGLIAVDQQCRTKVSGIYAIGDLTGNLQYAHRASAQGLVAAANTTGDRQKHSDALVPSCIFTSPEIGSVGLTEEEAKQNQRQVRTGKFRFASLGKARIRRQTEGFCKILADPETDQVLGVHIVGPHATDLIAEAVTAMNLEITAAELGRAMHAHPTLSEATMEAAEDVHQKSIHMPPPRR